MPGGPNGANRDRNATRIRRWNQWVAECLKNQVSAKETRRKDDKGHEK